MLEWFHFEDSENKYLALVFEKLSSSLYDFIKMNKYRGYPIKSIQTFARQIFEGIGFLHHDLCLTHTDLKPENLLLKHGKFDSIKQKEKWPKVK
jgi:dual-specificity kinase